MTSDLAVLIFLKIQVQWSSFSLIQSVQPPPIPLFIYKKSTDVHHNVTCISQWSQIQELHTLHDANYPLTWTAESLGSFVLTSSNDSLFPNMSWSVHLKETRVMHLSKRALPDKEADLWCNHDNNTVPTTQKSWTTCLSLTSVFARASHFNAFNYYCNLQERDVWVPGP